MDASPPELDFGVMCHGTEFSDWEADCLRKLLDRERVNLKLLIIDDTGADELRGVRGKFSRLSDYMEKTDVRDAINKAAWDVYRIPFDDPPCNTTTDLSSELDSAARIECDVREEGFSQYFFEDDIERIREHDLDFVLRFAFGIIRGEILDVPEYGVWSFHHNDERKYRGGPPCFWEVYNGDPVTGAVLQRLTDRLDGGIILRRGFFSTNRYSYRQNLNDVYYGTTEWPAQVATDILNGNAEYIDRSPTKSDAPIYRSPSPLQIASYNAKRGFAAGRAMLNGTDHWNIGVLQIPIEESANGAKTAAPGIHWYPQSNTDGYIADPFPISIDETTYIFVEDFSYSDGQGKISYIEYPHGFETGELETAHEEPFHMSYPYVFTHDGETYATPEIYEANEIRLYRLDAPDDWKVEATLVSDVAGVDPTLVKHEDRWWMFFTRIDYSGTKLYIWHSDELRGSWRPHENNPVKTDVRSSRPGGTPFRDDGQLYRPAQYCAGKYGKQVVINEVTKLTPTDYSEEKTSELRPTNDSPYPAGMHTLSSRGDITLIDGKRRIWNKHALQALSVGLASKILS